MGVTRNITLPKNRCFGTGRLMLDDVGPVDDQAAANASAMSSPTTSVTLPATSSFASQSAAGQITPQILNVQPVKSKAAPAQSSPRVLKPVSAGVSRTLGHDYPVETVPSAPVIAAVAQPMVFDRNAPRTSVIKHADVYVDVSNLLYSNEIQLNDDYRGLLNRHPDATLEELQGLAHGVALTFDC